MLGEWLSLTLDGELPSATQGRLPFGSYHIQGPGILELVPSECQPQARAIVVSAGIHGNETAPIELVGDLLARLEAGLLRLGSPTLVILGNLPSIRAGQRFCDTNLNRLFRRDREASDSRFDGGEPQRARELMAAVDEFYARHAQPRLHYDLHTTLRDSCYPVFAVEPFADSGIHAEQWRWLAAAGMQAVLHQHQHSWTFSHYSKHYHQAQAFTLELGKVHPFGANDLTELRPMQALLEALVEGREPPGADPASMAFFRVEHELIRQSEDFVLYFPDDLPNFSEFDVGTRLAHDGVAGDYVVEQAPLAVVFANANVDIGARAALLLRATDVPKN